MKAIDVAAISLLLCLIPMSAVLAEDCAPYFGSDFRYHEGQVCILSTCSGSCTERFCSIIPVLDQTQFLCILTNFWVVLGLFLLAVIIIIAGIITCICKSVCCLCSAILDCLCCRKQSRVTVRQTTTTVAVTNVIPRQPMVPLVCNMVMPSAGYQPLPSQPMHAHPEDKYELPPRYPGEENVAFVESP